MAIAHSMLADGSAPVPPSSQSLTLSGKPWWLCRSLLPVGRHRVEVTDVENRKTARGANPELLKPVCGPW